MSNVNEHAPVIRSGSRTSFTYREEGASVLYTYSATDGDKDDVITWTTGGDRRQTLRVQRPERSGVPGNRQTTRSPKIRGLDQVYNLTVVATDSGGLKRQPGR